MALGQAQAEGGKRWINLTQKSVPLFSVINKQNKGNFFILNQPHKLTILHLYFNSFLGKGPQTPLPSLGGNPIPPKPTGSAPQKPLNTLREPQDSNETKLKKPTLSYSSNIGLGSPLVVNHRYHQVSLLVSKG